MATTYKGLTIQFGGDTTGLSNALKKIQAESKSTQSELRAINQSLKFNPGNTDLLRQKTTALNATIAQTKDKLDAYKQALAQLEAKKASGEKLTAQEEKQYNQLQRSILTCENQLKRYETELKAVSREHDASKTKLYQFGQKLDENKKKLQEVGKGLQTAGKAIGGASVAAGGATIAALKEVSAGYDEVITKTGASGDELKGMEEQVKHLATSIPTDFETAGKAIGEVNTRFGLTGDKLEQLSGKYIKFARLNKTDVSTSVDKTQKALAAFGLDASKAGGLLDTLTKTGQKTGISVDALADGLVQNAKAFQDLGLDIHQSASFMGEIEMSGANSSKVMAGLGKALKNATADGTPLPKALKDIQDSISGNKKGVDGLKASYKLFGKSGDQIYNAVKNGTLNFNDLAKSMGGAKDSAGAVDETFKKTVKSGDKMTMAMNTLKAAGSEIGEELAPVITDFANGIKNIAEHLKNLTPEQKTFVANLIKVGAVMGGVLVGAGKAITLVSNMGTAFKTASTMITAMKNSQLLANAATKAGAIAQAAMNAVMNANPIVLVVTAIGALVAGLAYFFTQTETGRKLWAAFTEGLAAAWKKFMDFITPLIEGLKAAFGSLLSKAAEIGKGIADKFAALGKAAGTIFDAMKTAVGQRLEALKQNASLAGGAIKDLLAGNFKGAADKAKQLFSNMRQGVINNLKGMRDFAGKAADKIGEVLGFPGLGDKVRALFDSLIDFVKDPLKTIKEAVKNAVEKIKGFFNFDWKLPDLKLPHPTISGEFSLNPPSVPSFGIEWYAKGGAIAPNRPRLIGVGDSREREWIEPESKLIGMIESAVSNVMGTTTNNNMQIDISVNARVTGNTSAYQLGQNIGNGINSVLKQRGQAAIG